jgi:hypothetical protein
MDHGRKIFQNKKEERKFEVNDVRKLTTRALNVPDTYSTSTGMMGTLTQDYKNVLDLADHQRRLFERASATFHRDRYIDYTNIYWVLGISAFLFLLFVAARRSF